jgi:hypothetical protein
VHLKDSFSPAMFFVHPLLFTYSTPAAKEKDKALLSFASPCASSQTNKKITAIGGAQQIVSLA